MADGDKDTQKGKRHVNSVIPNNFKHLANLSNKDLNNLLRDLGVTTKGNRNHRITVCATILGISTTGSETDSFSTILTNVKQLIDGWTKDIRQVPSIELNCITDYLVAAHDITIPTINGDFESYTADTLRTYKALRAYDLWESGHIHGIRFHTLPDCDQYCALKCNANPSGDTSGTQYEVISILNSCDGSPVGGHCTCVGGLGEACTHIAGLLFSIEDFVSRGYKTLPDDQASTDKLCRWIVPRGPRVEPARIRSVPVRKHVPGRVPKTKLYHAYNYEPVNEENRPVDFLALEKLQHDLARDCPLVPWCAAIAPAMVENYRPLTLARGASGSAADKLPDIIGQYDPLLIPACEVSVIGEDRPPTLADKAKFCFAADGAELASKISWDSSERTIIENTTRGQSKCTEWYRYRTGLITASTMHRVATRVKVMERGKANPATSSRANERLVNDLVDGKTVIGNKHTAHGIKCEPVAANEYFHEFAKHHRNAKWIDCGLFISEQVGFIGATPDGIVSCDCHGSRLVEIKCPTSLEGTSDFQKLPYLCGSGDHVQLISCSTYGYIEQVHTQMACTGIHNTDFVVWSCPGTFTVTNVLFDVLFWSQLLVRATTFFTNYIAPKLMVSGEQSYQPVLALQESREHFARNISATVGMYHCGKCKQLIVENVETDKDASIQCECDCKCSQWFHWRCIGYTAADPDEGLGDLPWYCPNCVRNCDIIY
jgi:hypothetical protein